MSNAVNVITDNIGDALCDHVGRATHRLTLAAPFIKRKAMERLLTPLGASAELTVITRWSVAEIAAGVSDLSVLDFVRERGNAQLLLHGRLHAKVLLADDVAAVGSANHTLLTSIPFDIAITTNYDKLLERSYAKVGYVPPTYTHSRAPDFVDALWRKKFFILKAHGDVDHKTEMILTERDYRDIIYRSAGYQSALSAIFTTKSILFLGASLSDPETRLMLAFLHDAFHGSGSRHYALVSSTDFSETLASRWRKDYKVQLLTYDPTTGRPEVGAFLNMLIPKA
jgi:SIR2-like protein